MDDSKPADMIRVDIHTWTGQLIDRHKFKTTEKQKAALSILRQIDLCDISYSELEEARNNGIEEEMSNKDKIKEWNRPIMWKRDERGNII